MTCSIQHFASDSVWLGL